MKKKSKAELKFLNRLLVSKSQADASFDACYEMLKEFPGSLENRELIVSAIARCNGINKKLLEIGYRWKDDG